MSESNPIRRRESAINKCHTSDFDLFLFSPLRQSSSLSRVSLCAPDEFLSGELFFGTSFALVFHGTFPNTAEKNIILPDFVRTFISPPSIPNSHALELENKKKRLIGSVASAR